jgi:eukaryotic-like serine/threonine-protein kinase
MKHAIFSYRFGTAEFDESRSELRVAGLPVEAEPKALEVLAYLLRHAGEVVTKEELFREVWAGRVTVEKVLPNAINKLRRALGETNSGCVATVAWLGYRLDGTVLLKPASLPYAAIRPLTQFGLHALRPQIFLINTLPVETPGHHACA